LHLFKSSTLCRRPGRYAGGSSSGPRSTVMQFCAVPDFRGTLNTILPVRRRSDPYPYQASMWHISFVPGQCPPGGKSGKRRRLNLRMPHHRHDQIDLDNGRPGRREWSMKLLHIFVIINQQIWHSAIFRLNIRNAFIDRNIKNA
jgi:hypothetical protein